MSIAATSAPHEVQRRWVAYDAGPEPGHGAYIAGACGAPLAPIYRGFPPSSTRPIGDPLRDRLRPTLPSQPMRYVVSRERRAEVVPFIYRGA